MTPRPSCRRARGRRRGTVLIVTMLIAFALAGVVLTLGRTVRVELSASMNLSASVQATAVERGAEQYLMAVLLQNQTKGQLPDLDETFYAQIPVGEGYFWVVRPDYNDPSLPVFGLVDEAGKINLNTVEYDALMKLPNMTTDVANGIIAYRGASADAGVAASGTSSGAQSIGGGYYQKNAPFELVEEALQVQGFTREMLYGNGQAGPLGLPPGGLSGSSKPGGLAASFNSDVATARGLYDFFTVYSVETGAAAATSTGGGGASGSATSGKININSADQRDRLRTLLRQQFGNTRGDEVMNQMSPRTRFVDVFEFYFRVKLKAEEFDQVIDKITTTTGTAKGRINVNTAPRDVLLALPGLESADVDKLIAARPAAPGMAATSFGSAPASSTTGPSLSWVATALNQKAVGLGQYITGSTSRVSADIVAAAGNGRAFKRVRVVFDVSGTTPQVIYRRELTDRGWPLDPQILDQLRAGQGLAGATGGAAGNGIGGGGGASGGMLR